MCRDQGDEVAILSAQRGGGQSTPNPTKMSKQPVTSSAPTPALNVLTFHPPQYVLFLIKRLPFNTLTLPYLVLRLSHIFTAPDTLTSFEILPRHSSHPRCVDFPASVPRRRLNPLAFGQRQLESSTFLFLSLRYSPPLFHWVLSPT